MWSRSEYVYALHLVCRTGSTLAICTTCHLVQPWLNGLVVALSRHLQLFAHLTVEDHRNLIARCPDAIPLLLPIAALVVESSWVSVSDEKQHDQAA